jgi:transcription termination/antitermination protein NusG
VNDESDNSAEQARGAELGHVVGGAQAGAEDRNEPTPSTPLATETREHDNSPPGDELALPSEVVEASGAPDAGGDDHNGDDHNGDDEDAGNDEEQEQLAAEEASANGDTASGGDASEPEPRKLDWFILKVQSNREDSIREALLRRIAVAGLGESFDQIIVPIEKVSEFKNGKKRVVKRKLYPGYLVVHMEYNDDTWYLVRETPGIGDFTGSGGKPTPMAPHEVSKIISIIEPDKEQETPRLMIPFKKGERVKITEGTFENFEGEVDNIDEANGRVTVMINIFGRSTPVELEYWQIDKL